MNSGFKLKTFRQVFKGEVWKRNSPIKWSAIESKVKDVRRCMN